MKKKTAPFIFVAVIVVIAIIFLVISNIVNKNTPSKKHISEDEMYKLYKLYDGYTEDGEEINFDGAVKCDESQAAIVLQNKLVNDRAVVEDGVLYVEYSFVKNNLNSRFYWDNNENILIFTTPTDVIKAEVGSSEYYVTKVKNTVDYTIVKTEGDKVFVAMDFVKLYSNIE